MIYKDIIEDAKEAGIKLHRIHGGLVVRHRNGSWIDISDEIAKFAELIRAKTIADMQGEQESDDKNNQVTLDKRDLFDFVRGAIKDALTTDENADKQANLWSEATARTDECLSELYDNPAIKQPIVDEQKMIAKLSCTWGSDCGWQYIINLLPEFENDKFFGSLDGNSIYLYTRHESSITNEREAFEKVFYIEPIIKFDSKLKEYFNQQSGKRVVESDYWRGWQARAQLSSNDKDAERYRWIREHSRDPDDELPYCVKQTGNPQEQHLVFEENLDAAIDAAIKHNQ